MKPAPKTKAPTFSSLSRTPEVHGTSCFSNSASTPPLGAKEELWVLGSIPSPYYYYTEHHRIPRPALEGSYNLFRGQICSDIRFSITILYTEVARFLGFPFTQFHPNFFCIMASVFVHFKMHYLLINHLILHYYFFRFHEGKLSLTSQVNSQYLDDIPSSLKGWKGWYFFVKVPSIFVAQPVS